MRLTVKQLKNRDPGHGIAVIDRTMLADLGVSSEDFVAIEGSDGEKAVAQVWPSDERDAGRGNVRIDGQLRQEANVSIDDRVPVQKVDVAEAKRIEVAVPESVQDRGDVASRVRNQLADRAVTAGQTVGSPDGIGRISPGSSRHTLIHVVDTDREGPIVVTGETIVDVVDRSLEDVLATSESTETVAPLSITYEDIGGLEKELELVREMIELPMQHPELFQQLGIEPPKGLLLYGPPGTGKTLISKAVATEIDAHFQTISGPEIMSKYYGESEEQLRDVFEVAEENEPAIVFIDELDSIAPKRGEVDGDVERRVVAQLLSLMDGLDERGQITVIGTTNRIDAIDPALRRPGRFDREIEIGVPDREDREEIFAIQTRRMPLSEDVDLDRYAENTQGFVGADLESLAKESAMVALRRVRPDLDLTDAELTPDTLKSIAVTDDDVRAALQGIEPSAMREVIVETPEVSWADVGGLDEAKERLKETVQWPMVHASAYDRVALDPAKGVLLYGPPGTGKTLLAKAVANEAQSNFISIKGPELFDKYVGESEKGVREVFAKARENAPAVVFFDEIDAIAAERGEGVGDASVGERVVSQLLTELDGLETLEDVVVIATTNRPDMLDDALLRSGRLDRHVAVDAPNEAARRDIFEIHTRARPLASDVDLDELASRTEDFVGADIEGVCREAATTAVRDYVEGNGEIDAVEDIVLTMDHFETAIEAISAGGIEEASGFGGFRETGTKTN